MAPQKPDCSQPRPQQSPNVGRRPTRAQICEKAGLFWALEASRTQSSKLQQDEAQLQHRTEEGAGGGGGTGAGVHASGEGPRGYLLLHSAFGPSSMQLREKTEPEGQGGVGETQNTGEEHDPAGPGCCDGSGRGDNRTGTERAGAGPEPQEAHSCPPPKAVALTPLWEHSSCPRFSSLGCGPQALMVRGVVAPMS